MAAEWWDPKGKFAVLHRFNPVRLAYIREQATAQFDREPLVREPLSGLRLLDIGCGGGLLSEPMARLGANVTAIDPSPKNIATASVHASAGGLEIDYRAATAEELAAAGERFDVVLNMEVIEHVPDVRSFAWTIARLLRPGGVLYITTPDLTHWSQPRDLHRRSGFGPPAHCVYFTPGSLVGLLDGAGFDLVRRRLAFKPGIKLICRKRHDMT